MNITLNVSTDQEAFTAVKAHLTQMTRRATGTGNSYSICMYRVDFDPSGNRCAIGALIPDEQYRRYLDEALSSSIGTLIREGVISTQINASLLHDLQRVHDVGLNWEERYDGTVKLGDVGYSWFADIAHGYGLQNV